jgi:hypothetical protein
VNEVSSSSEKRGPRGRLGAIVALVALAVLTLLGVSAPSGAQGYASTPSCSVSPSSVAPGGTVTVVASGFLPGSTVTFEIERVRSSRAPVGQATANEAGTATAEITVPSSFPPGSYSVTCRGLDAEGAAVEVVSIVRVVDGTAGGGDDDGTGGDDLARTGSNTGALARIAVLLVAGGAALLLFGRKRSQRAPSA